MGDEKLLSVFCDDPTVRVGFPCCDKDHYMKKLLTLVLSLTPALLMAQELTADTPAANPTLLAQILEILYAAITTAIAGATGLLIRQAIPLLNAYLKQIMHFRGASVVADALTQAIAELSTEAQKALADGKIDKAERAAMMLAAQEIAHAKLLQLSGFYKENLRAWIDDQLNIALSKLLSRTMG